MEIWKDVTGFEGVYQVSNMGRVRSLDRIVMRGDTPMRWRGRIFANSCGGHGYPQVNLRSGGVRLVHHLVWESFVGARTKGLVIRHKNDNKLDARLENLVEGTHLENMKDSVINGIRSTAVKPEVIEDIKRQRAAGVSLRRLAEQYGTSHTTIRQLEKRSEFYSLG